MNTDATRTDHAALTAARRAAQDEENKRTRAALLDYACAMGNLLDNSVRLHYVPPEPAPVSYDWRDNARMEV
jgi:hypothetical protein